MSEYNLDPTILHAVVDGELDAQEHAAAIEAIEADANASLRYAEFRRLKSAVAALPQAEVPSGAWRLCTRRLDEIDRNRKAERFVTRYAWALSASVFLLVVGAGSWNRLTGQHLGASDVAQMASVFSPIDRTESPDNASVGKWLQDRVGANVGALNRSPVSAEFGPAGAVPMARLVLVDRFGRMALYVWRGSDVIDGFEPIDGTNYGAGTVFNQNAVAWVRNDCHFVLVGQRDVQSLERVAEELNRTANRPTL